MDDFNAKLTEILNDPKSMEKVRQMAENLLGDGEEERSADLPDPEELNSVMSLLTRFKSCGNDARTGLLIALKPHLGAERQAKVDTAIKLLKLIELLPYLKESGLLNL